MVTPLDPTAQTNTRAQRLPQVLLGLFALWWALLALAPKYRADWLLENLLVFAVLPLLVWGHQRIRYSNRACTGLFLFFCLHALGAHYTYSEVPWNAWLEAATGWDATAALDLERNHYDRAVHFSFGLLVLPAIAELLDARGPLRGIWRHLVPLCFVMANSELYELIEWQAAERFGGELGQAYLGTQGDVWDAQKDSALALCGALLGLALHRAAEAKSASKASTGPKFVRQVYWKNE